MADRRVADRLLPAADALDEVGHVVIGYRQARGVGGERLAEQARIAGPNDAAADEDPLVVLAGEMDAVLKVGPADQARARRAVGAVVVRVGRAEIAMAIVRP